jgi:hypothetical protein
MNKSFFLETTNMITPNLYINGHWIAVKKLTFFRNPRWPPLQDLDYNKRINVDPIRKIINAFS